MKPVPPTFGLYLPPGFDRNVVGAARRYPALPEPENNTESALELQRLIKETLEILTRDRGDVLDSSVKVRDLPAVADYVQTVLTPLFQNLIDGLTTIYSAFNKDDPTPITRTWTDTAIKLVDIWDTAINEKPTRILADLPASVMVVNSRARAVKFQFHLSFTTGVNEDFVVQLRRNDVETIWETVGSGSGAGRVEAIDLIGVTGPAVPESEELSIWVRSLDPTMQIDILDSVFIAEWVPNPPSLA